MRRLIAAVAIGLSLLLATSGPVLAITQTAKVFDGFNQTGSFCGGITSGSTDLGHFGGCGNWDNRISSVNFSSTSHCLALFLLFDWQGSRWSIHTSGVYNAPSGFNKAVSSLAFGTWHDGGPDDRFCDAPYF